MARANSLILPRSTWITNGGYSLPLTLWSIWIGIRPSRPCQPSPRRAPRLRLVGRASSRTPFLHGAVEEAGHVAHHEALVPPLGDLLLLVEGLDLEDDALAIRLQHGGLRAHLHPDGGGGD